MQVFKFGGASVKDAEGIKNVASIVTGLKTAELLIVISAVGKTTNQLEEVTHSYFSQDGRCFYLLNEIRQQHIDIVYSLFGESNSVIADEVINSFVEIEWILEETPQDAFDYLYDQIVPLGEILSTKIIAAYFSSIGINTKWVDARDYIFTDNTYREAHVDWKKTEAKIRRDLPVILDDHIILTQGFIGSTSENFTTTLGRDGSDYSAAIFASCLHAENVTIWKDVPGVLNADPKWFEPTELISELSYTDAIELTYYGANVIHPKTIKPLQNLGIPLHVRSFVEPASKGTQIKPTNQSLPVPSFIFKVNQVFVSVQPRDFSFIVEDNFSHIFNTFHENRIKVNMMHNSAICFSVSIDDTGENVWQLLEDLEKRYKVSVATGLELITIRHYNQETIDRVLVGKTIIREVKDSYTCQMLVKNKDE